MPTLDWIGKKAVVNHHREVPYLLLHCEKSKSVGDPDAGNLLVQGDNLEALKALLPYYAGKVKCISTGLRNSNITGITHQAPQTMKFTATNRGTSQREAGFLMTTRLIR